VLPFSLWHDWNVPWNPLGQQLATHQGRQTPEPLKWQDVDCSLGDTYVHLIDPQSLMKAGPFPVVAKFASQRSRQPHLELSAVLGMNFLTDDRLRLVLDGTGGSLAGRLSVP
jgi:hypothetical protein